MRFVYFIRRGEDGPIKIGVAADPFTRLRDLQTGCPERFRLLAAWPGDLQNERSIHRSLARHRIEGEWFAPSRDVLSAALHYGTLPGGFVSVEFAGIVQRPAPEEPPGPVVADMPPEERAAFFAALDARHPEMARQRDEFLASRAAKVDPDPPRLPNPWDRLAWHGGRRA